jgi:hypothetical protein
MKYNFLILFFFFNNSQQLVIPGKVKLCGLDNNCFRVNKFEVPEKINKCTIHPAITLNEGKNVFFLNEEGQLLNKSVVVPCNLQEIKYSLNIDGNTLTLNRFGNKMYVQYAKSDGEILSSFSIPPWLTERCKWILGNKFFQITILVLLIIGCIVFLFCAIKYNFFKHMFVYFLSRFSKTNQKVSSKSPVSPTTFPQLPTAGSQPTSQTPMTSSQNSPTVHQSSPMRKFSIWPQIQLSTAPSAPCSPPLNSSILHQTDPVTIESDQSDKHGYNLCQEVALSTIQSESRDVCKTFDFYPPPSYEFENQMLNKNEKSKALPKGWKKCPTCPMVTKALHNHICKKV